MKSTRLLAFALLAATPSFAQKGAATVADTVLHKRFVLRDFSGDSKIEKQWDGTVMDASIASVREFSLFEISRVNVTGTSVYIDGPRVDVFKAPDGKGMLVKTDSMIHLTVNASGMDQPEKFAELWANLFFPSINDAVAALPRELAGKLPAAFDAPSFGDGRKSDDPSACDCEKSVCTGNALRTNVKPPVNVSRPMPEYTPEAKTARLTGAVWTFFTIDPSGTPTDFWLIKRLGMGLDENALIAARGAKFEPATCHDMPVSYPVPVKITFDLN